MALALEITFPSNPGQHEAEGAPEASVIARLKFVSDGRGREI